MDWSSEDDFDLLRRALALAPELYAAAALVKRARSAAPSYPLEGPPSLIRLLGAEERLVVGGHVIGSADIQRYVPAVWFPIADEDALLRTCHLALVACREEAVARRAGTRREHAAAPQLRFIDADGRC